MMVKTYRPSHILSSNVSTSLWVALAIIHFRPNEEFCCCSGSSMTDGSPLVSIRKSLARVKAEIVGMDVRVSSVAILMMMDDSLPANFHQAKLMGMV